MKTILYGAGDRLEIFYDDGVLYSEYVIDHSGAYGDGFVIMFNTRETVGGKIKLATFYNEIDAKKYIALIASEHDKIQKKANELYIEMSKGIRKAASSLADNICSDLYKKTRY